MRTSILTLLATCLSSSLFAGPTTIDALVAHVQKEMPGKHYISVVCDYSRSQDEIQTLASTLGSNYRLLVIDAHTRQEISSARTILQERKPDCLMVLPNEQPTAVFNFEARVLSRRLQSSGIPTVGFAAPAVAMTPAPATGKASVEVVNF